MNPHADRGRDHLHTFPASGGCIAGMLYDARRCGAAPSQDWFDPDHYGERATPVGAAGGRGRAWFVEAGFGSGVLRHYQRGGLVGRILRDRYLWLGAERTRCQREFRLLRALHGQGLPVPAPIAAGWWRRGPCYRQALLTERIPGAVSVAHLLRENAARAPWEAVGQAIARFHRAGVWHADLNAHNILRDADGTIWLIDFDRSWQGALTERQREQNLLRLRRSLQKLGGEDGEAGWQRVYTAWLIAIGQVQQLPAG